MSETDQLDEVTGNHEPVTQPAPHGRDFTKSVMFLIQA
jgi:hypothetical protein